jgi:hypothetical protein
MPETSEKSFETVIESHLLENRYISVPQDGFDREQAIFPQQVLMFMPKRIWKQPSCGRWRPLFSSWGRVKLIPNG